jgi:putative ABC transport system permease protein
MLNDLRSAVRGFARNPGFTFVAVLTLALGIGATTAVFTVVHAVLLTPLPYAAADRLVVAHLSLPDYRDLTAAATSFEDTAAWASNLYNLEGGREATQVLGGQVSGNLLTILGVDPVLGRTFTAEDARQQTVVLGYGLWQSQFGGDPSVLGRRVRLSGVPYTVIGVAPAWFSFPSAQFRLWTPLELIDTQYAPMARNRSLRIFNMLARLRPGRTLQQAQGEAAAVSSRLAQEYPATNAQVSIELEPLYERIVGDVRPALQMLLGTVALLLLIACANVANLMLARTTAREREIAIRRALGAGRGRLVRQLAVESGVLALAGGTLGLLVAMWGVDALPTLLETRLPRAEAIGIDATVLMFAAAATVLTAVFFGTAPALQSTASASVLKESGRGTSAGVKARRTRRLIVVAEVALAVVVVIGAGLMARSLLAISRIEPGFTTRNLLTFNMQLIKAPDAAARARIAEAILGRIKDVPGVQAVGGATGLPAVTPQRGTRFEVDGRQLSPDEDGALFVAATPDYFRALETPIVRGRAFEAGDRAGAPAVVIVNRTLANTLFPGGDAVGQRIRIVNPEQSNEWRTVVGVAGDVLYQMPRDAAVPTIYTPFAQTPFLWMYVMTRVSGPSERVAADIRALVPSIDAEVTAANLRMMDQLISAGTAEPRLNTMLITAFALLALALAAVGIYGVVTYSVAQRTHEIGVRMALGAASGHLVRLVVGEGLAMTAAGVVLGLAGAAMVTRWMSALLFGVTARDPITFTSAAVMLLLVSVAACWIPARRATRVEPVVALRQE